MFHISWFLPVFKILLPQYFEIVFSKMGLLFLKYLKLISFEDFYVYGTSNVKITMFCDKVSAIYLTDDTVTLTTVQVLICRHNI